MRSCHKMDREELQKEMRKLKAQSIKYCGQCDVLRKEVGRLNRSAIAKHEELKLAKLELTLLPIKNDTIKSLKETVRIQAEMIEFLKLPWWKKWFAKQEDA